MILLLTASNCNVVFADETTVGGKKIGAPIVDGVNAATRATVIARTNSNAVAVAIIDGTGTPITSFGGGTQYTEEDSDSTITGTALMGEATPNTLAVAQLDSSHNLKVAFGTGSTVKIADINGNAYAATIPVSVASIPAAATNNTTKIADINGNVYASTIPVSLASVPSHAVTNAGVFATQDTPATGATMKAADRTGNVFTGSLVSASIYSMDVKIATASTITVGNTPDVNLKTSSITLPVSVASAQIASGAIASGAVASGAVASGAIASGAIAAGAIATGNSIAINNTPDINIKTVTTGTTIGIANSPNVNQAGTWTVQPGNTANSTPWIMTPTPGTTGGWSAATEATLGSVVQLVKNGAGNFGGYYFYNQNATAAYLQVFDATSAANSTLTTLKMIIGLPATSAANVEWTNGVNMANGVCVRSATTATGNTATASPIEGSVLYK